MVCGIINVMILCSYRCFALLFDSLGPRRSVYGVIVRVKNNVGISLLLRKLTT